MKIQSVGNLPFLLTRSLVYSCGLLPWTALLDGQSPWELEVFGGSEETFQEAKMDEATFLDIALTTSRALVPSHRSDDVVHLLSSLLCPQNERDLSLLLQYSRNV